jgi:hypothetical protein
MSEVSKVEIEQQVVATPEPFHLIVSHALYQAIKSNQGLKSDGDKVNKETAEEFEKFKVLFKSFLDKLNKNDESAYAILSNIMSMWGYSRKYCGMCGKPIVGRPGHIENRMVCPRCFDAFRIAEELYKRDAPVEQPHKQPPPQQKTSISSEEK